MTGARKPGPRGERDISRKTIAWGMPGDPAEPMVTAACFFCCRRAMGEVVTRHSLRPLIIRRREIQDKPRAKHAARSRSCAFFSLAPFLRGEGGVRVSARCALGESPSPEIRCREFRPLPASAFARRRASADKSAGRGDSKRCALGCLKATRHTLRCHRPRMRATQYSRGVNDRAERSPRTGYPHARV